ncbi:Cationic amino acid transporter-1 [Lunasporangiospora selenospora]|uniref:Cationic amino acid transporter-1 n=1 Tax=Lunasporangiospora selenospora TaxID=979761 RepID=A0A9P6FPT0_9FUNG|nr:Cationic amino acid transporter-1 [Lunasporangiospora selenospora]
MASMIPIAGSAYTYAYASIGELAAWIIGWDLVLEYLVGAATVSVGWSSYLVAFLHDAFDITLSTKWTRTPVVWKNNTMTRSGDYFNIPAFAISAAVSTLVYYGIHTTAKINNTLVVFKVLVLIIIIFAMIPFIKTENYHPYFPDRLVGDPTGDGGGVRGMLAGASIVFFAYIGFDSISTTAQEAKEPQVNLPIGIMSTIVISSVLYVGISVVTVGVAPYNALKGDSPIVEAVKLTQMHWLVLVTELGALAATTSVILVLLIAQSRVFYAMANDGLIPRFFAKSHPRYKTPFVSTLISGILCSICGGLLPIGVLSDMSSVGTIFAYFVVNIGVIILRFTRKTVPRRFKVPGVDEPMRVLHEDFSVDTMNNYNGYTDDDLRQQYSRQMARRANFDRPRLSYYQDDTFGRGSDRGENTRPPSEMPMGEGAGAEAAAQDLARREPSYGFFSAFRRAVPSRSNVEDSRSCSPKSSFDSSHGVDSGHGIGAAIGPFRKRSEVMSISMSAVSADYKEYPPAPQSSSSPESSPRSSHMLQPALEPYPERAHVSSRIT